jgi:DNA-binding transcriptional ArsR family regulator
MAYQSTAIQALGALGDPTRRAIFEHLAVRPAAVGEIAATLPVTRSAVSQHLRVLRDSGLVSETAAGVRRIYRLDPRGIAAMRDWLNDHWATALESFKDFTDKQEDNPE